MGVMQVEKRDGFVGVIVIFQGIHIWLTGLSGAIDSHLVQFGFEKQMHLPISFMKSQIIYKSEVWRNGKMSVNGIGAAGYKMAEYAAKRMQQNGMDKSFAEQVNNAAQVKPHTYIVYMKTDDMLYSGGNGTGLSFYIRYAEDSTEDDPTVVAKGVDENGDEFEQTIHINKINPHSASLVEMRALESYLDVDKNGGLSSLPMGTGMMGLHDRANFMDMFQKQISDMKLLSQRKAVEYYQYSMQEYWDFMDRK